ncbi:MAG: alanine racemase [Tistrella sp.]|uniref:Alanine racemase n=1 Tax=Tistrella mobilis TaxID=171437 RepID=A0A3B9ITT0_9PROT|nr:alanine racemase [Tistrella sp.]MAD39060.1 alanine racemase [Tistrella sp.]MBA74709.1 alanine racemase [Tistrella sp.]HAE50639.1 alanine racemase [Tistrella mobilis]
MAGLSPDLQTPCLVVDEAKMTANLDRMARRIAGLGVGFRPHLKTAKSVEIARRMLPDTGGPATVSTLREAEVFAAAGVQNILYAVGITPAKLDRVQALRARGYDLAVILDSAGQAQAVAAAGAGAGPIPVLIEIDCDGKRAGLAPHAAEIIEIGRILHEGRAELRGVMTHAGGSYDVSGDEAHAAFAERERRAVVTAADRLRAAGLPCPVVSVGSTPTALAARDLAGVTEVRAGVYVFFDLVMAGIGVCAVDDIALSVATTVIGHRPDRGWTLVDAGWMALSRDRGTAGQAVDQGYGLVADATGRVIPDLIVTGANQEHGILALRPGAAATPPDLPVGTVLRILPNHACATAAQFDAYHVIPADAHAAPAIWPRFGGW